jgi:hypothetical protein
LIKLTDYSPIRSNRLACLFVFAIEGAAPVKIGHALNVPYRLKQVQLGQPRAITIEHLAWVPSAATGALIAEDIRHKLAPREVRAGWYQIEIADAIAVVRKACALFRSRGIVEHEALMQQLADVGYGQAWA